MGAGFRAAALLSLAASVQVQSPAGSGLVQAPAAARVPQVRGTVLSGENLELPEALRGKTAVLVVGFSQGARPQVTAWGKRLAGDYRDTPRVMYLELAQLGPVPRMLRGWVLRKISESVPDRAKGHFLPVYDHEAEWRAAAGYRQADDAYVLVVDEAGTVRYRFEGPATDQAYAEVKRRLDTR